MGLAFRPVDDDGFTPLPLRDGQLHMGGERRAAQAANARFLDGRDNGRRLHAVHILTQGRKVDPFVLHVVADGHGHFRPSMSIIWGFTLITSPDTLAWTGRLTKPPDSPIFWPNFT